MTTPRILIYLVRRDLRLFDNPVLYEISRSFQHAQRPFTHLLPLYVFAAQQVEVSGFLSSDAERSPFPEARSPVGGFWRCGPHRAQFLAETVWDSKKAFEAVGSGLEIRVGMVGQVVKDLLDGFKAGGREAEVVGVWMTDEEGVEERREERDVKGIVEGHGKEFRLWVDEKYFVDECDILISPIFATKEATKLFGSAKVVIFLSNAQRTFLMFLPPSARWLNPSAAPLDRLCPPLKNYHPFHRLYHHKPHLSCYPPPSIPP
jgi:hypothetical protein